MLGRIALRKSAAISASSKLTCIHLLRTATLHTTGVAQKDKDASEAVAVPTQGLLDQAGLTDWKISAPIIGALAIPAISNHFYVLNEESQLACCFLLFCSASYKFGGEMIASYFDDRAAAILGEHNAVEDANLDLAKATLETHMAMLDIHEDIAAVAAAHKEAVALLCDVQAYKLRHKTRETFVKNLESIREIEASYQLELQKSMVANATSKVRSVVQKGDKKLKDAAFKHAVDILANVDVDDKKEDDVAALFTKELRAYATDLEAKQGQVISLTDAEQSELQADLDAYMHRFGLEDADFKAPKEIKLELM
uniref:ATP synthase subunit b n=1 Tax=Hyaloperonospora arabidopsidis (strain Emoy2) TaxID=559515 RepID=M4B5A5_HYAAE